MGAKQQSLSECLPWPLCLSVCLCLCLLALIMNHPHSLSGLSGYNQPHDCLLGKPWFTMSVQPHKSNSCVMLRGGLCIFNIFLHHSQSLPTCCTSIPSFLIPCPICYPSLYLQKLKWFDLIVAIWRHLNCPHQIKIKLSWSISFPSADKLSIYIIRPL